MKKIVLIVVAMFSIGMYSASAQKFAHISYESVMDTLATYKKAMKMQEEFEGNAQTTAQILQKKMQEKYMELENGRNTLSSIELDILQNEFEDLQMRLQGVEQEYQKNMQIIQERYVVKIDKWLKEAVDAVGKEKGVDYILYHSAEGGFFWVNPNKGVDLTNAVITKMLELEKIDPVKEPGK
ncbi:OmpH family outer membrane protein [Crocinitomix algicola]|uniref:OmpH family outer membrane protein n=1 Tax=Crocinitomix algicola TaxID=1740263 RepID=UPI0008721CD0|nr:OmpH family outer membrane protein [Crocinitomix algicola]